MGRGKASMVRHTYHGVTGLLRDWARSRLHVLGRGRGTRREWRHYQVVCLRCGRMFRAVYDGHGWRPVCIYGEDRTAYCPAAVFGYGENI